MRTGRLHTTGADRKNAALFCQLLWLLASLYDCGFAPSEKRVITMSITIERDQLTGTYSEYLESQNCEGNHMRGTSSYTYKYSMKRVP